MGSVGFTRISKGPVTQKHKIPCYSVRYTYQTFFSVDQYPVTVIFLTRSLGIAQRLWLKKAKKKTPTKFRRMHVLTFSVRMGKRDDQF